MRPRLRLALAITALSLATAACDLTRMSPNGSPSDPTRESFDPRLHIDLSKMQKTPNGIFYYDSIVGTGAAVTSGAQAADYYWIGYLKNAAVWGGSPTQPETVDPLSRLPAGWLEGMLGMQVGGKRVLVIPSAFGYGDAYTGAVPPNSTLVVGIGLVNVRASSQ